MFMKSTLLSALAINGVLGLVIRSPQEGLPLDEFDAADTVGSVTPIIESVSVPVAPIADALQAVKADIQSDPVTPNSVSKLRKRDSSCPKYTYVGNNLPVYDGLENDGFSKDASFASMAQKAGQNAPFPYATKFTNQQGSYAGSGFLTAKELSTYDPKACADFCSQTTGCVSFNLFIERDPLEDQIDDTCSTKSISDIKCGLWSVPFATQDASDFKSNLNNGQYRGKFHVTITASNGYTSMYVPGVDGYTGVPLPGAIQGKYYMGVKTFPVDATMSTPKSVTGYNANFCAQACDAQTAYNKDHGGDACNYFTAYLLTQTKPKDTSFMPTSTLTCALYSWAPQKYPGAPYGTDPLGAQTTIATNFKQARGDYLYTAMSVYGYTRN